MAHEVAAIVLKNRHWPKTSSFDYTIVLGSASKSIILLCLGRVSEDYDSVSPFFLTSLSKAPGGYPFFTLIRDDSIIDICYIFIAMDSDLLQDQCDFSHLTICSKAFL